MLEKTSECDIDKCLSFDCNYPINTHSLYSLKYKIIPCISVIDYNVGLIAGATAARSELWKILL